jgi:hypothetical protein
MYLFPPNTDERELQITGELINLRNMEEPIDGGDL